MRTGELSSSVQKRYGIGTGSSVVRALALVPHAPPWVYLARPRPCLLDMPVPCTYLDTLLGGAITRVHGRERRPDTVPSKVSVPITLPYEVVPAP